MGPYSEFLSLGKDWTHIDDLEVFISLLLKKKGLGFKL